MDMDSRRLHEILGGLKHVVMLRLSHSEAYSQKEGCYRWWAEVRALAKVLGIDVDLTKQHIDLDRVDEEYHACR